MATQLNIKQWAKYHRDLAKEFWPAVQRGMRSGALRAVSHVQKAVDRAPPASPNGSTGAFDTGAYKRSWKSQVLADAIKVYNEAPYSGVIEDGRRAGGRRPPAKTLESWVRRKLGVSQAEAKGIAFVIARAIGRRGLKGRHVLADATDEMARLIEQEIERELDKVLEKGHK